jgi:CRISPR-associated exonuclease Cas4
VTYLRRSSLFSEDDLLPLSALQHLLFCERQCGLIHLEQLWDENRLTAEGRILHEKVHEEDDEQRRDLRIVRGLRLRSLRLGLIGQADVVEYRLKDGKWVPYPVEYKRGKPKPDHCDEIQLCAQAICLEEMNGTEIPEGAVFYGRPRKRHVVCLDEKLRSETVSAAARLHELISAGVTPRAVYEKKCDNCSLVNLCLPKTTGKEESSADYLKATLE